VRSPLSAQKHVPRKCPAVLSLFGVEPLTGHDEIHLFSTFVPVAAYRSSGIEFDPRRHDKNTVLVRNSDRKSIGGSIAAPA